MRSVSYDTYRACFAYGLISGLGARKVIPERSADIAGYGSAIAGSPAEIEEWHAGTSPAAEVIARKVIACSSSEYWVRADLADAALLRIAEAELEVERIKRDVIAWSAARDQAAADAAGLTLEQFRLRRNHAGMERDRRAGKYGWMGR